jgi:hypothetical protein
MSWYAQSESTEDTLLVAFANLLKKFSVENVSPASIRQKLVEEGIAELDWPSITVFNSRVVPDTIGDYNTWPSSNNAIVCFQSTDRDNNVIFNYCVVNDHLHETIVDSLDGQEKPADTYGKAISWASFSLLPLEAEEVVPAPPQPKMTANTSPKKVKPLSTRLPENSR